jgi:hypothetical protein
LPIVGTKRQFRSLAFIKAVEERLSGNTNRSRRDAGPADWKKVQGSPDRLLLYG